MYAQAVLIAKRRLTWIVGISLVFLVVGIILWGYFTCWKFVKKCPEEEKILEEMNKEQITDYEDEMKEISEGKMCNFVNIKDVIPNPDKNEDGDFDVEESVPCETCENYKLNGIKMYPEFYDSQKKDGLFYCRASLA